MIMKTLYLVRHGKSSWENMMHQDYERPLLPKGVKRTKKVASFLSEKNVVPDLIISSHAVRAFETAKIIAGKLGYPQGKICVSEDLYFLGQRAMENLIFGLDDKVNSVMLVGHNPDMTNFANSFLVEQIDYMPTTGVVCVNFKTIHWTDIFLAAREILFIIRPRDI
jgi:phosphohistidine phosphatase